MAIDMKEVRLRCIEVATSRIQPNRGLASEAVLDLADKFANYVEKGIGKAPVKKGGAAKKSEDNSGSDPLA